MLTYTAVILLTVYFNQIFLPGHDASREIINCVFQFHVFLLRIPEPLLKFFILRTRLKKIVVNKIGRN